VAGKSTLNRLELVAEAGEEDRYKKLHYDAQAIDVVLVDIFLEAHTRRRIRDSTRKHVLSPRLPHVRESTTNSA